MDSTLVPYSPIMQRPALRWPNGARVALWVVPNIEHYEYQPKYIPSARPGRRAPHVRLWRDSGKISTVDLFGPHFGPLAGRRQRACDAGPPPPPGIYGGKELVDQEGL